MTAALALTDREVVDTVGDTIRRAYGGNLKLVARDGDVREDTAKNWVEKRNAPNLATFFRLCRASPELRAEAMRLMGMEAENDPAFMRDVMKLFDTWQRMKGGADGVR